MFHKLGVDFLMHMYNLIMSRIASSFHLLKFKTFCKVGFWNEIRFDFITRFKNCNIKRYNWWRARLEAGGREPCKSPIISRDVAVLESSDEIKPDQVSESTLQIVENLKQMNKILFSFFLGRNRDLVSKSFWLFHQRKNFDLKD